MGSCMSSPEESTQITSTGGTVYNVKNANKSTSQMNGGFNNGYTSNGGISTPNGGGSSSKRAEAGQMGKSSSSIGGGKAISNNNHNNKPEMGQPMIENKKAQRERSYAIDKQIEEDSKKYRKECKILLLGEYYSIMQDFRLCVEQR